MRQEYLDVISKGYSIEICVDYDASGRSVDEDDNVIEEMWGVDLADIL